jgi:hypothetical protein
MSGSPYDAAPRGRAISLCRCWGKKLQHCDIVLSVAHPGPGPRALASLRVIKAEHLVLPAALMQRCAATLTELECSALTGDVERVIPRCLRLESLAFSNWWCCPPDAWLGLSQLHTLRGVSLAAVPTTAIAATLPRLHTLHLDHGFNDFEFSVDPFYDELLPRLRSFGVEGAWPETSDTTSTAIVPTLPLLEDLKWRGWAEISLPRLFLAARRRRSALLTRISLNC